MIINKTAIHKAQSTKMWTIIGYNIASTMSKIQSVKKAIKGPSITKYKYY